MDLTWAAGAGTDDADVDQNRQDFSHCEANVKSLLDEVLRRGSVSVKPEWGRWLVGDLSDVLGMCVGVGISGDERAACQQAASWWLPKRGGRPTTGVCAHASWWLKRARVSGRVTRYVIPERGNSPSILV
jgi:hypothetical protein